MSLLLNEDFSLYQLRLAYLQRIHDGVGERLINLNTSVLNNPAFRAAGWLPDAAAVRRCYSPPIPTTGAGVSSEYFQAPRKTIGVNLEDDGAEGGAGGGMVTGNQGTDDTVGTVATITNDPRKRRKRKEQLEEDDSSDLSDDSDEEDKTAASGIQFRRMPVRRRSQSDTSPVSTLRADPDGPALNVISPSRPPDPVNEALRRGSLGQVEGVKQRARRDTTTSSEFSSENELDPNMFTKRLPGRPGAKKNVVLSECIQEEEQQDLDIAGGDSDLEDEDVGEASDLSDEFELDAATSSALPELLGIAVRGASDDVSPIKPRLDIPPAITPHNQSPKKASSRDTLPRLARLPTNRPISTVQQHSLLTMALKGNTGNDEKAFQRFAALSGKGEAQPLWIKIFAPFSEKSSDPIEVPLRRSKDGNPVTVVELIGLALWRYQEEEYAPALRDGDTNVNQWDLRIVEDEEVDLDFPALVRTRPVTDFTSNNNRPPQRRARDKPWDEFGLVRATNEQLKENEELTPQLDAQPSHSVPSRMPNVRSEAERPQPSERTTSSATITQARQPARNPITGPSFTTAALRKDTAALDLPQRDTMQSTPRTGASKTVTVYFTDPQSFQTSTVALPTTTDTYIAELFDAACKRFNLDKALYVLKVHGTQTVAPSDRTVEALGDRINLDLARRRFINADGMFGLGLSGSPGSSSPNAPLELTTITTPTTSTTVLGGKKKKTAFGIPKNTTIGAGASGILMDPFDIGGKKYNVLRKQPLSFAPSHPRTLIITPEYLQILPAGPDSLAVPTGKVTNVPMSSIIGAKVSRKHPKMVRVLVYREAGGGKEDMKRYDFECNSREEANAIVEDVRRGVGAFRDVDG